MGLDPKSGEFVVPRLFVLEELFFNAKACGQAGRDGDTIGMRVCAKFECPANIRAREPLPYLGFDRGAEVLRRIGVQQEHVLNFATRMRDGE